MGKILRFSGLIRPWPTIATTAGEFPATATITKEKRNKQGKDKE